LRQVVAKECSPLPSIDIRAYQRQAQTQTLSPRLQHAVRLLQMSSLDFATLLRETMGRNPFLESDDGDDPHALDEAGAAQLTDRERERDFDETAADSALAANDSTLESTLDVASDARDDRDDRDVWQADGAGAGKRAEDGEMSAMDMMAVETPLNAHLHQQLSLLPLDARDAVLARVIIESLDDDGYLRTSLEELAELAEQDPPATLQEMQIALKLVQSFDPLGVGARNVPECLLLQLPSIDCRQSRGLAQRIIEHHLNALAQRDIGALARQLGESPARVEAVCDRIRRLDPRPGWRMATSRVAYVVPDVIVKKVNGQWSAQLNPAIVPKVRLNQVYADLFQRHRSQANAEMAGHLQEARWTVRNVEQRFSTILDVAQAIVRRQRHFLEFGAMAMKPLGLKENAEEVGIHESTVSRVTNNKYMATPIGVFELKYFFSRAMVSANGSACSGTAIRGLIKDIIEAEKPDAPLSDAEITRQLAQQGLVVARRTVTKYRQMLKIEAVDRRRRHAA
jgi:RNA polymerase sigma-54 factor